ncbi:hypothetical protein O1611_g6501 [Lasiodiplodia mahajangana]|uniref:Uncharacterized protein n=1 Tax=Lasiodiplodia mahajangana TaxID=1108764 RepID=A0ACC2JI53_9PEZI|nr:hypothetical protein O1611_g6501 [Lasiodiplodia mahajangana]
MATTNRYLENPVTSLRTVDTYNELLASLKRITKLYPPVHTCSTGWPFSVLLPAPETSLRQWAQAYLQLGARTQKRAPTPSHCGIGDEALAHLALEAVLSEDASLARAGQPGIKTPLTAARWGFYEVLNKAQEFEVPKPFGSWVVENVIFKVLAAEGHGLTALEATMEASKELQKRGLGVTDIENIHVRTQEAAMIIINKKGPLHNPADRDHCLRYMMAVVLLKNGAEIEADDYQDDSPWANDARVNALRSIISMEEDPQFTQDYHNPQIRSVGSAITISLKDGTAIKTRREFPLGHAVRDEETVPLVRRKATRNLGLKFPQDKVARIMATIEQPGFGDLPTSHFVDMFHE